MSEELFRSLTKYQLLATGMLGEARGEPVEGRIAVGCTVRNRVKLNRKHYGGSSWFDVMLKREQFDCFKPGNPNHAVCVALASEIHSKPSPLLQESIWLAFGIVVDRILDNTAGATHYHAAWDKPYWIKSMTFTRRIGNHLFYRED